jgi:glycosyltransferase involved in cell wall biosynthesis
VDSTKCRSQFPEHFPEVQGRENLLFLGVIHEKKGLDLLLWAYAEVYFKIPRARLWWLIIAGPGEVSCYARKRKHLAEKLQVGDNGYTWTSIV